MFLEQGFIQQKDHSLAASIPFVFLLLSHPSRHVEFGHMTTTEISTSLQSELELPGYNTYNHEH